MAVMSVELEVQGMSCGHCVAAITSAVQPLPGVEAVEVDLDRGRVLVTGAADERTVTTAIEDCGYDVSAA